MRSTKTVVEENVLEGRDAGPRLTAWMVHYAAQVIGACMVGADGLTPFRRLTGRKFGTPLAGFGERVAQRSSSGKSEQVQSETHRGEVAWVLSQVVALHRGRLQREVPHGPDDQESQR